MNVVALPARPLTTPPGHPASAEPAQVVGFPASRMPHARIFADLTRRMDGPSSVVVIRGEVNKLTKRRIATGVPPELANRQAAEIETAALVRVHTRQRRPGDAA